MPVDAAYIDRQIQRYKDGDSLRANWRSLWEDCARFGAPRRMGAQGERTDGDRRVTPQIYNPIGIQCTQTLAAALHGMVMNPATKWLNIRLADDNLDEQDAAKHWTSGVSKRIANALGSPFTAFHTNANQLLEDLASLGTAVMYVGQQKTGHLYVRTYPIFECVLAENEYGFIDTVMRDGMYTTRQMVNIWGGMPGFPSTIRALYDKGKYDEKHKVLNITAPRDDKYRDTRKRTRDNMPIAVCYIFEKEKTLLEETGAEEMPYVAPRWWVASGEINGRSPLMTALPQIKVSNVATKTVMDASEKAVNPPLTVPHEGLVGPVRRKPGGLTYLRNKTEIGQLPTSSALAYSSEYIQQLDNAIRTTMFVDQVQFTGDFKMTATEVLQRQTERMRLLGPVLGRLETEFLNPFVTRVFGIMARNNQFERPPQEIQDADLRIEYQSPLARAQKSQIAQGFQQVMATIEPLAKALPPQIAEQLVAPIDWSKVTPALFDWFGVDVDLLREQDDRDNDKQQAMLKQLMQALPGLAGAMKDGAGGLQSITTAGKTAVETSQLASQGGAPPVPPGETVQPPNGAPPAPAQDLQQVIASIMQGGASALPGAVGVPADVARSYLGGPQQ
jgi:hypothetical protein